MSASVSSIKRLPVRVTVLIGMRKIKRQVKVVVYIFFVRLASFADSGLSDSPDTPPVTSDKVLYALRKASMSECSGITPEASLASTLTIAVITEVSLMMPRLTA